MYEVNVSTARIIQAIQETMAYFKARPGFEDLEIVLCESNSPEQISNTDGRGFVLYYPINTPYIDQGYSANLTGEVTTNYLLCLAFPVPSYVINFLLNRLMVNLTKQVMLTTEDVAKILEIPDSWSDEIAEQSFRIISEVGSISYDFLAADYSGAKLNVTLKVTTG